MTQSADVAVTLKGSEAIFAVSSVVETVKFYRTVLGFTGEWLWGEPPTFGGVCWGKVQVMLCQQPELAAQVEGHQHHFYCETIDDLHAQHRAAAAKIISPIGNKPWGLREYTVRDLNGYHLRFSGPEKYERPASARSALPEFIAIEERMPTVEEYLALTDALGWHNNPQTAPTALANSLDRRQVPGKQIAGSIRVIGDRTRFFYIQDVMVLPALQHQQIGAAMMETTMAWLRQNAAKGESVYLFTGKPGFYERFGFRPNAGGMSLVL
jgi:GNAT superfamily N-acetyltransferase